MDFNQQVERRLARNFGKLLKLRAEVNNISSVLSKAVASLNETNAILQSLPLYTAIEKLDRIHESSKVHESLKDKPALTLIVTE